MGLISSKPGKGSAAGILVVGDGVADLGVGNGFDVGEQESDFAGREFFERRGFGRLIAKAFHFENLPAGPQADFLVHAQAAVQHAHQNDDAAVRIEPGIENQRAQRRFRISARRRHALDDGFEQFRECRCLAWRSPATHRPREGRSTARSARESAQAPPQGRSILLITGIISRL